MFITHCNKSNKPIAFAKDGMITRIKVDEFDKKDLYDIYIYELDRISRHNGAVMKNVYFFNLGFDEPYVESEERGAEIKVEQVFPFCISGNVLLAMVTIE